MTRMQSMYVKQKYYSLRISFMRLWKVWSALRKPKDMNGKSKNAKGVVIAVFWMSSGWTGI